ncbi:MAG: PDZ domain-containing protein [Alphaproteobacteria bacterium]|nr:PDZ domain-containing protein [Alphaproteobacteria bacterium]
MHRIALVLLVVVAPGAISPARAFADDTVAYLRSAEGATVVERALTLLAERYLDPVRVPDLAIAGLQGLRTFDRALSIDPRQNRIRLLAEDRVVATENQPTERDIAGWGAAATRILAAAAEARPALQTVTGERLMRGYFEALFDRLDPYSRYVPPMDAREEREIRRGQGGVGLRVERSRGGHVIVEVIPESPAAIAGISEGERLVAVNGRPVGRLSEEAVYDLLRGPEDSRVGLTIRRASGPARSITLHRALVAPNTVEFGRLDRLAVFRISAFNRLTHQRLSRLLVETMSDRREPVRGVILDLRGNRGGLLRQAVSVADLFLTDGPIMSTRGRHPDASRDFEAADTDLTEGLPLVVLIDGRSASAAEIVAGALQDRRRAVLIGSVTLGKGLVQSVSRLPDDGDLIVTWARVIMPAGYPLQDLGVLPAICTSLGREILESQLRALDQGRLPMASALSGWRAARPGLSGPAAAQLRSACPPAEGREDDIEAARWILERPNAYAAALVAEGRGTAPRGTEAVASAPLQVPSATGAGPGR